MKTFIEIRKEVPTFLGFKEEVIANVIRSKDVIETIQKDSSQTGEVSWAQSKTFKELKAGVNTKVNYSFEELRTAISKDRKKKNSRLFEVHIKTPNSFDCYYLIIRRKDI